MKSRLFSTTLVFPKKPTHSHYEYYTKVGTSYWTTLFKVTGRHINFFQAIPHQPINTYQDLLKVLRTKSVANNTLLQAILINRYQQLIPKQAPELMGLVELRSKCQSASSFQTVYEMTENIIKARNQPINFDSLVRKMK